MSQKKINDEIKVITKKLENSGINISNLGLGESGVGAHNQSLTYNNQGLGQVGSGGNGSRNSQFGPYN